MFSLPFSTNFYKIRERLRYIGCWIKARSAPRPKARRIKFEPLEARVLLSASPMPEPRQVAPEAVVLTTDVESLEQIQTFTATEISYQPEYLDLFAENGTGAALSVAGKDLLPTDFHIVSPKAQYQLGEQITVSWTVTNNGDTPISGFWVDYVVSSADATLNWRSGGDQSLTGESQNYQSVSLAPGASYTETTQVTLRQAGNIYLGVQVDAENFGISGATDSVTETDETNNTRSVQVTVIAPDIDLTITNPSVTPGAAVSGSTVNISFKVNNTGGAATPQDTFYYDAIYLSADNVFNPFEDQTLEIVPRSASVAGGGQYTVNQSLQVPDVPSGNYYLYFVADDFDLQGEKNEANNVSSVPLTITGVNADLAISDLKVISGTVAPNGTVTVSYKVTNTGSVAANGTWKDEIWVDSGFNSFKISTVEAADHPVLASGESYTITRQVVLPNYSTSSTPRLRVEVDAAQTQGELSASNNTSVISFAADLVVSNLQISSGSVGLGDKLTVTYTVTNTGAVAATSTWYDQIWLETTSTTYGLQGIAPADHPTLAPGASYTITREVTIPVSVPAGNWKIRVDTDAFSGQSEGDNFNNSAFSPLTITQGPLPDLVFSNVTVTPSSANHGSTVTVSWTVTNNGTAPATENRNDGIYLSLNGVLDFSNDRYLDAVPVSDDLAIGESRTYSREVTLAGPFSGPVTIFVAGDLYDDVAESNESNNKVSASVTITTPAVDLIVESGVTAPATAIIGDQINVSFSVKNQGSAATTVDWFDEVYISTDAVLSPNDLRQGGFFESTPLAGNNASYAQTGTVNISDFLTAGNYYLIFVANADGDQGESNFGNNSVAVPIQLQASTVDLSVVSVTAPLEVPAGDTITVTYTVKNNGSTPTTANWTDFLVIANGFSWITSASNTRDDGTPIPAGGTYTGTFELTVPPSASLGERDLELSIDFYSQQHESNNNNNTFTQTITITEGSNADLTVSDATVPSTGIVGSVIPVSYTVLNQGQGPTRQNWKDYVYLSDDPIFDSSDTLVSEFSGQHPLVAGDDYTVTNASITLPGGYNGLSYLIFVTDAVDTSRELDETNNYLAKPITLSGPDLTASGLIGPSDATLGSTIKLSYTITNSGSANASGYWTEGFYLSTDATFDESDLLIGSSFQNAAENLAPGASVAINDFELYLPSAPVGQLYLFVKANGGANAETNRSNNVSSAHPITITGADLVVSGITSPASGTSVILGQTFAVNWTILNQGNASASGMRSDSVYLSDDAIWDSSDSWIGSQFIDGETPLAQGASSGGTANVTIPNVTTLGTKYLIVKADDFGGQAESSDNNNTFAIPITVGAPNLTVTGFNAPAKVRFGETVEVSWTVKNDSSVTALLPFYDTVFLSPDGTLNGSYANLGNQYNESRVPLAPGASYTITRNITIPTFGSTGNQFLVIQTDSFENARETNENDNILTRAIEVIAPDLAVQNVSAPTTAQSGQTITVNWQTTNLGAVATGGEFYELVTLRRRNTGEVLASKQVDFGVAAPESIAPNQVVNRSTTITLPDGVSSVGELEVVVTTNYFSLISEGQNNLENNSGAFILAGTLAPYPDLVVQDLTVPTGLKSGQEVTVTWKVANTGNRATSGNFYDTIVVENIDTGAVVYSRSFLYEEAAAGNGPISVGQTRDREDTFTLPDGLAGTGNFRVRVQTDAFDQAFEYNAAGTATTNNVAEVTRASTLAPYADLQVTNLTLPSTLESGQQVTVTWKTSNTGAGPTTGSFTEWVIVENVSTGETLAFGAMPYLEGDAGNGPIAAGGSRDRQFTFTLPDGTRGVGDIKVTVITDYTPFGSTGAIKEYTEAGPAENNNTTVLTKTSILANYPDLQVSNITPPSAAASGQQALVQWTVTNNGNKPVNRSWSDRIRIVNTTTGVELVNTTLLYDVNGPGNSALAAGGAVTRNFTFTLPADQNGFGNIEYFIETDAGHDVLEIKSGIDAEANNTAIATANATMSPTADLVVTTITPSSSNVLSNQDLEIAWTIRNQGSAATLGGWKDRLWLSADDVISADDLFLGEFAFNGTLGAGEEVERLQSVHIPIDYSGMRKVLVQTDAGNDVIEANLGRTAETNNFLADNALIDIDLSPFPNLVVTNVIAPQEVHSGQQTSVSWTVMNIGDASTSSGLWRDAIFLSADTTWDASDILLGVADNASYLNPTEAYNNTLNVTIPNALDGTYYFLVRTDTNYSRFRDIVSLGSSVYEGNENDNVRAAASTEVELTPPPDLQVTVNAPSQAFSGQLVTVSWTVTNHGPGRTDISRWSDSLFLSADGQLGDDIGFGSFAHGPTLVRVTTQSNGLTSYIEYEEGGFLEPGESYTFTREVRLPVGLSGDFQFLVHTDSSGALYEHALDGNNVGTDPIKIVLTPPPDLEVESISLPPTAQASHNLTINYRVANNGSTETPNSQWNDAFWLSIDDVISDDDIFLGTSRHFGQLQAGQGYDGVASFTLPNGLTGDYRVLIKTDSSNDVFELANDNNVASSGDSSQKVSIVSRPADLAILAANLPQTNAQAGGTLRVNWTIGNLGEGDTVASDWTDEVWISNSPTGENARRLGEFRRQGGLNPGESYFRSELVQIPLDLQGSLYVFVKTTSNGQVYEAGATANNVSQLMSVTVGQQIADLRVTQATASPTTLSGQQLTVSWTVKNFGNGPTNSNSWYDHVLLSTTPDKTGVVHDFGTIYHSGLLLPNGEYSASATLSIPIDLTGTYYVIVETDVPVFFSSNLVFEGANEGNNARTVAGQTTISLGPVPDLEIISVNAPDTIVSGQPFDVSWTVKNNGGIGADGSWFDSFYLSRDKVFDPANDIFVGSARHDGGLGVGSTYSGTASLTLNRGLSGTFYLFAVTDSADRIYERTEERDNRGFDPVATIVTLAPPADLVAGTFPIPTNAVPGQNTVVTYTVTNNGTNVAAGTWTDSLYLSLDDEYDLGDILLGRVQHSGNVAPGASYTETLNAPLPGVIPGNYRVIVRSDVRNQVNESDESNNLEASLNAVAVDVPTLPVGTPGSLTLNVGRSYYYKVTVGAGEALLLTLDSGDNSAVNQLFVSKGRIPTISDHDFSFTEASAADQEITVPVTDAGDYYVLVRALTDSGAPNSSTIKAEYIPFGVRKLDLAEVGNFGSSTIELTGARYTADTQFELVGPTGEVIRASRVVFKDSSVAYATFDLAGKALGAHDVRATIPNGATATLDDALQVRLGSGGRIAAEITGPGAVRAGGQYIAYIELVNHGDADSAAPAFIFLNRTGIPVGLDADEKSTDKILHFYAADDDELGGILRPGERKIIPIFFTATAPLNFGLITIKPNDTTPIDWTVIRQSIVENGLAPEGLSPAEFEGAFARLQTQIGGTWGDYVNTLGRNATLLPGANGNNQDARPLLELEFRKAIAATGTSISGALHRAELGLSTSGQMVVATNISTGESFQTFSLKDGSFLFERLPAGNYQIEVDRALVKLGGTATVAQGQSLTGLNVSIERGASVTGIVTAAGTNPAQILANAIIRLRTADGRLYTAVSDELGRYTIPGLPVGTYQLSAEAPGRARVDAGNIVITSTSESQAQNLSLVPESVIKGNVIFQSGGSASALNVMVVDKANPANVFLATVAGSSFSVGNLPAGSYELTFTADGYVPISRDVTVGASLTVALDTTTMLRAATIGGSVTSLDPEIPNSGIFVGIYQGETLVAYSQSNAQGQFQVTNLQPGTYTVKPVPGRAAFSNTQTITVSAGQDITGLDVRLLPGGVIGGRVRNEATGQAIAGVNVLLSTPNGGLLSVQTDENGRYRFEGLEPGSYTTFVRAAGAAPVTSTVTQVDGTVVPANFNVNVVASLKGTLTTAGGGALEGVVSLVENGSVIATTRTDTAGNFLFLLDRAGIFTLQAASDSGSFAPLTEIAVNSGDSVTRTLSAGSSQLQINVSDATQAVAGADVILSQVMADGSRVSAGLAEVNASGSVSFTNLAPGTYEVSILGTSQHGVTTRITVGLGTTTSNVALSQLSSLEGTVTGTAGALLKNATLMLRNASGELVAAGSSDSEGKYHIDYVPAGTYELVVVKDGYAAYIQSGVTVNASATSLNLTLAKSTTVIAGRVLNQNGQPIRAGLVTITDASGRYMGSAGLENDGTFAVDTAYGSGLQIHVAAEGFERKVIANFNVTTGTTTNIPDVQVTSVGIGASAAVLTTVANATAQSAGGGSLFAFLQTLFEHLEKDNDHVYWEDVPEPCSPEAAAATISERVKLLDAISYEYEYFRMMKDAQSQLRWQTGLLAAEWFTATIDTTAQITLAIASVLPVGAVLKEASMAAKGALAAEAVVDSRKELVEAAQLLINVHNNMRSLYEQFNNVKVTFYGIMEVDSPADAGAKYDQFVAELNAIAGLAADLSSTIAKIVGNEKAATLLGAAGAGMGVAGALASIPSIIRSIQGNTDQLRQNLLATQTTYQQFKDMSDMYDKWVGISNQRLTEYIFALEKCDCNPDDPRDDDDADDGDDDGSDGDGSPWGPSNPFAPGSPFGPGGALDPDKFVPPFVPAFLISRDPNDIIGPAGFGPEKWVNVDQRLDYTIRFENASDTSGAAQEVTIVQRLDPDLDWRSFRLDDFGFGDIRIDLPGTQSFYSGRVDLMAERGYVVDVFAFIDVQTGTATWTLKTIDPVTGEKPADATLGFLPPNNEDHIGEGFVSYSIKASRTAPTGASIDAEADIVFDINAPIITPVISNKLDSSKPISQVDSVTELATDGELHVSWSGTDPSGSALANFDVYVSDNNGAFQLWLEKTTLRGATYAGVSGHTYKFYTVARDNAGNIQSANQALAVSRLVTGQSNQAPNVQADRTLTVNEDAATTSLGITAPTDPENDGLIISVTAIPDATKGEFRKADGTTVRVGNLLTVSQLAGLVFTPAPNVNGAAGTFAYTVNDGRGGSASQTVTIQIASVNDLPVVQGDKGIIRLEDSEAVALGITAPTDIENDTLTITVNVVPTSGKAEVRRTNGTIVTAGTTLTIAELTSLIFAPALNANGDAGVFRYTVSDGNGGNVSQSVSFNLTPVNDLPVAQGDKSLTVLEDAAATNLAITLPIDVDGDTLTITINSVPDSAKGVIRRANNTVVTAGMTFSAAELADLVFVPVLNANGATGTFKYTVNDGNGGSATQSVTLGITPVNDLPVVDANKTITLDEDALPVNLATGAPTDVENDALTITADVLPDAAKGQVRLANGTSVAAGATLTLAQLSGLVFVTVANANGGAGTFKYTVNDGNGGVVSQTITFSINAINDLPVLQADKTITVLEDSGSNSLNITAPTDVDGDALTITVTGLPTASQGTVRLANGTVVANGATLTPVQLAGLVFEPSLNQNGDAGVFSYRVSDGQGGNVSQSITLKITAVNDAPVADADKTITVLEDSVGPLLVSSPTGPVLAIGAPTDVDGDTLTIRIDELPTASKGEMLLANGTPISVGATLTVQQLQTLVFRTVANANGPAGNLVYTVLDGNGGATTSRIALQITAVNDAPVVDATDSLTVLEDSSATPLDITLPTDVDGDTLTVRITALPDVTKGQIRLDDGSLVALGTMPASQLSKLRYVPVANANGPAGILKFEVDDGNGGVVSQEFTLSITAVNDVPNVEASKTVTLLEDAAATALNIAAPTDVEGDALTVTATAIPAAAKGVVKLANGTIVSAGTVLSLSDLSGLTFTPTADANGTSTFSYSVSDGNGGTVSRTITFDVTAVNDAPVADLDKTLSVLEDSATGSLNLSAPVDVDQDALTITITSVPDASKGEVRLSNGTVVTNGSTITASQLAALTFTPVANANGAAGTFSYTVADGKGGSDTQTVTINITAVNDVPVLQADKTVTVQEGTLRTSLGITAPTDADGNAITLTVGSVPDATKGEVVKADGTVLKTGDVLTLAELAALELVLQNSDVNGAAGTFSYTANDGNGGTSTQTITVAITPVNDAPVAGVDTLIERNEDAAAFALQLPAITDVDGDPLTVRIDSIPTTGEIRLGDGTVVTTGMILTAAQFSALQFAPTLNANGSSTFTYTVLDGQGGSDSAEVTIKLLAQNDAPVAEGNRNLTVAEDSGTTALEITAPTDADGDQLTITVVSVPQANLGELRRSDGAVVEANTSLTLAQLAGLVFVPRLNAYGAAGTFEYEVTDGTATSRQQIAVTITPVNDAPVVGPNQTSVLLEDSATASLNVVAPSDLEGDTLTIKVTQLPAATHGALTLADGTPVTLGMDLSVAALQSLQFTPVPNANGSAGVFAYQVADTNGGVSSREIGLQIDAVNDAPVHGGYERVQISLGTPDITLNIGAPTDIDGDILTIQVNQVPPSNQGRILLSNGTALSAGATISVAELTTLRFAPAAGFAGISNPFQYTVQDGHDGTSTHELDVEVLRQQITFTKSFTFLDQDGDKVTITIAGPGSGEMELVNGLQNNSDLYALRLSGTTEKTSVTVKVAKGGETSIGSIATVETVQHLSALTLGANVLLGNPALNNAALTISGGVKKLTLDDIAATTTIQIGAAYGTGNEAAIGALKPAITIGDVIGNDVSIDVNGGISKFTVGSWSFDGEINTLSTIGLVSVKTGSFGPDLLVDSTGAGPGVAGISKLEIKGGDLTSNVITAEGAIGTVSVKGKISSQLTASGLGKVTAGGLVDTTWTINTGNVGNLTIKGAINNALIAVSAGAVGKMTVSGESSGPLVQNLQLSAGGKIGNISVAGKVKANGSVVNSSIYAGQNTTIASAIDLKNTAIGTIKLTGSLVDSTLLAAGNVGAITLGGNATGSRIIAGSDVGVDGTLLSSDDSYNAHGSIAALNVKGALSTTTVVAGVNPGADFVWGSGTDIVGAIIPGITTRSTIGTINLGATTVTGTATQPIGEATGDHQIAITSLAFKKMKIGKVTVQLASAPLYIDANADGAEQGTETLIRIVAAE